MKEGINETGMTMDQVESLLSSILKKGGISLRATAPQDTPNVPKPEDIDTGDRTKILKGIKQVTFDKYQELTEEEREQYVFFVREDSGSTFGFVGIGNLKYTMVPEDIRGIDCGFFPTCEDDEGGEDDEDEDGEDEGTNYGDEYFTINVIDPGTLDYTPGASTLYYSMDDGENWNEFTTLDVDEVPKKILLKGNVEYAGWIGTFYSTNWAKFEVSGNIMSLLYGDDFIGRIDLPGDDIFKGLFENCEGIVNAENLVLPAEELTQRCYLNMFANCQYLEKGPVLPATVLADNCYQYMFVDCIRLIEAPELPATELADSCYWGMFYNCLSITTAPELPAETLVRYCYNSMFTGCVSLNYVKCLATNIEQDNATLDWMQNVRSTGTFVKDVSMNDWETGVDGIPAGWVVENV